MIISVHRFLGSLGLAAFIAAAAGVACGQDKAEPGDSVAQIDLPELALDDADILSFDDDLFLEPLDDDEALPLDAPPKPVLGPEPEDWAAWRRAIDARLDRGVFADITAALRAPDYLIPRGARDAAGVRDALSSFFAGGAPFNQRLVTPAPRRGAAPARGPVRPPPGPEGGTPDELAGFFAGVARNAARSAAPPPERLPEPVREIRPEVPRAAPLPAPARPARPATPPPAFAGPPPLRVAPPAPAAAPRRTPPPPRVVAPPPSIGDEPELADDLEDFFADS